MPQSKAGLKRDAVLAAVVARSIKVEPIDVPEWGGTVYARRLSAGEVEASGLFDGRAANETTKMAVALIIAGVTDEAGAPLFTADDADALASAEFTVVMRVFAEVAKLNGLSTDDLEEATAGFAAAQHGASSTS